MTMASGTRTDEERVAQMKRLLANVQNVENDSPWRWPSKAFICEEFVSATSGIHEKTIVEIVPLKLKLRNFVEIGEENMVEDEGCTERDSEKKLLTGRDKGEEDYVQSEFLETVEIHVLAKRLFVKTSNSLPGLLRHFFPKIQSQKNFV